MKKSIITALGIFMLSLSAQSQEKISSELTWSPWKPGNRSAGIYFKPRTAAAVYGLTKVADGKSFAEVDELSNMGQYLETKPGEHYTVKYAIAHRKSAGDKVLRVAVNGELANEIFIDNNTAPGSFSYQTFQFKAVDAKTFVGFYLISLSGDPNKGVLIDDVSITAAHGTENLIKNGSFEAGLKIINRTARSAKGTKDVVASHISMLEDQPESFDAVTNFKIGQYYYHHSNVPARSLVHFELAKAGNFQHLDLDFYLGRAYHLNHKFSNAVAHYHKYSGMLRNSKTAEASKKSTEVRSHMEDCMTGSALLPDSLELEISNLGRLINSQYQDYIPLVSADESTLIFTSRRSNSTGREVATDGSFYEDIFMANKNANGTWSKPTQIAELNSELHDAGIGLSNDGKKLFIYSEENGGDILMSSRKSKGWTKPQALQGEVNSKYWEGSASISKDGEYLYFASNRPGGYGGIDLYRSQKQPNGIWGKVVNLGPVVNTPEDEDAPQIHTDDVTLFFSSKGHQGMGGYDIYSTTQDQLTEAWSNPKNVGYPINTAQDDIHFSLNAEGSRAYFNSSHLTADGQNDIFMMERPETSASRFVLKGKVVQKEEDRSFTAKVILTNKKTSEVQATTTTDLINGTYAFNMAFNTDYHLSIESQDQIFNTREINIEDQADLFQYVMNFVVDNDKMYIIEQQNISQITMNEKNSYVVLAESR
ncbi:MAG: hypothetical protein DHS20C17_23690 [Cyclobacteriaceae bacterium]|nr:MAG: hypothetical protein DHS20C17_23690 [Cyclobacteriaceae bacterium]